MSAILSPTLRLAHISQLLLTAYGARFSYLAITKLRAYEDLTKKAAEWTQVAQDHLDKTRATQAAGAGALLVSFVAAGYLLLGDAPRWSSAVVSPVVVAALVGLREYVRGYWANYKDGRGRDVAGMRVPLPSMEGYNEAERCTERLLEVLGWVSWSWVVGGVVGCVGLVV